MSAVKKVCTHGSRRKRTGVTINVKDCSFLLIILILIVIFMRSPNYYEIMRNYLVIMIP